MVDWWSETEHAMVECLASDGPMSPKDLAQRLGISDGEATVFVCMLAREKKISICLVSVSDTSAGPSRRGGARVRRKAPAQRQAA